MDQNNPGSQNYHSFVKGIVSEGTYHPTLDDGKMAEIVDRIIDHVASQDLFGRCLQAPRGDQLFHRTMKQKEIVETIKKDLSKYWEAAKRSTAGVTSEAAADVAAKVAAVYTANDVLFGGSRKHPGSKNFFWFIHGVFNEGVCYKNLDEGKKLEIVDRIKNHLATLEPPGRFLKESKNGSFQSIDPEKHEALIKKHLSKQWRLWEKRNEEARNGK
jgi:hypothetical protein